MNKIETKKINFEMVKKNHSLGFTMIEMILVMVILAALSIGIMMFMNPMMDLMVQKNFSQGPAREGRMALTRMIREINQINNDASITAATGSTLTFTDVNSNTIAYALNSTNLTRNGTVFAGDISGLSFVYYDENNNVLVTPTLSPATNIRRIEVALTISAAGQTTTVRSQSRPRNIGS